MNFNMPNTTGTGIINPIFSGSVANNANATGQTAKNLALSKVYLRKTKTKNKNDDIQSRYLTQGNGAKKVNQTLTSNIRAELNIRSDYGDSPATGRNQNHSINYDQQHNMGLKLIPRNIGGAYHYDGSVDNKKKRISNSKEPVSRGGFKNLSINQRID